MISKRSLLKGLVAAPAAVVTSRWVPAKDDAIVTETWSRDDEEARRLLAPFKVVTLEGWYEEGTTLRFSGDDLNTKFPCEAILWEPDHCRWVEVLIVGWKFDQDGTWTFELRRMEGGLAYYTEFAGKFDPKNWRIEP